jgi:hypothetical protein
MELPPAGKSVVGHGAYFVGVKDGRVTEFSSRPHVADLRVRFVLMPQG